MQKKETSIIHSIIGLKCPRCRKGNLFTQKGIIVYRDMLGMNDDCPNCGLHYELENGFWLGSLWTSYPIVVIIEVPFLFAALFADDFMTWVYFGMMLVSFLITWPLMLRLGRSIWIHLNVSKEL